MLDTDRFFINRNTNRWCEKDLEKTDVADTSDYLKDNSLYHGVNKKILRMMKDYCVGTPISEKVVIKPGDAHVF